MSRDSAPTEPMGAVAPAVHTIDDVARSICEWLTSYLANVLALPTDEIDDSRTFQQYGLDSSAAVGLTGDLADWLGCDIDPAAAYEHPSIRAFTAALARRQDVVHAYRARIGDGHRSAA